MTCRISDQLDLPPLEEEIRRRAYEIWLQRGGYDASDVVDWLLAAEDIRAARGNF